MPAGAGSWQRRTAGPAAYWRFGGGWKQRRWPSTKPWRSSGGWPNRIRAMRVGSRTWRWRTAGLAACGRRRASWRRRRRPLCDCLAISRRLAEQEPDNAGWHRARRRRSSGRPRAAGARSAEGCRTPSVTNIWRSADAWPNRTRAMRVGSGTSRRRTIGSAACCRRRVSWSSGGRL